MKLTRTVFKYLRKLNVEEIKPGMTLCYKSSITGCKTKIVVEGVTKCKRFIISTNNVPYPTYDDLTLDKK